MVKGQREAERKGQDRRGKEREGEEMRKRRILHLETKTEKSDICGLIHIGVSLLLPFLMNKNTSVSLCRLRDLVCGVV